MADYTTQENIIPQILKRRWMWHAAFWGVYFGVSLPSDIRLAMTIPEAVAKSQETINLGIKITAGDILFSSFCTSLIVVFFSYFIILFLYPIFFAKQRYSYFIFWGIITALALNVLIVNLSYWLGTSFIDSDWWSNYLGSLSIFALFLFLVTMCKFFKDSIIQQQLDNQRFREAKQAELDNLKAQLSPHFLFNTLNNFYGLAVSNSKQLPDLMLRLSDLMRYSLYETHLPTVPLSDEIKYMKNYIELEKIRLEDSFSLDFNINNGKEMALLNAEIAPLILIVFVENTFKHTRNLQNDPIKVSIELRELADNWLYFSVENNYLKLPESLQITTQKTGGLGLENVRKRLEALYPAGLHSLEIVDEEQIFTIKLKIKLR